MSNENKKMERSWLSSTAMKLALLSASAASLVSCEGLVDRTDMFGANGVYLGGTRTASQTNLAKVCLAGAGIAANTYVAIDNNETAVKIAQAVTDVSRHYPIDRPPVQNMPPQNMPPVQNRPPIRPPHIESQPLHAPVPIRPVGQPVPISVHDCMYRY